MESTASAAITEELLKTLRAALSNVARHASASAVDVHLSGGGDGITLRVADNGVGLSGRSAPGHGLENMRTRAEALGGTFRVSSRPAGDLVVTWWAPLSS